MADHLLDNYRHPDEKVDYINGEEGEEEKSSQFRNFISEQFVGNLGPERRPAVKPGPNYDDNTKERMRKSKS